MDIHDLFPDVERPDASARIRAAATKIRSLRSQIGPEGLTSAGYRTLIEELTVALNACADALGAPSGEDEA